jgi:hypothetical protein
VARRSQGWGCSGGGAARQAGGRRARGGAARRPAVAFARTSRAAASAICASRPRSSSAPRLAALLPPALLLLAPAALLMSTPAAAPLAAVANRPTDRSRSSESMPRQRSQRHSRPSMPSQRKAGWERGKQRMGDAEVLAGGGRRQGRSAGGARECRGRGPAPVHATSSHPTARKQPVPTHRAHPAAAVPSGGAQGVSRAHRRARPDAGAVCVGTLRHVSLPAAAEAHDFAVAQQHRGPWHAGAAAQQGVVRSASVPSDAAPAAAAPAAAVAAAAVTTATVAAAAIAVVASGVTVAGEAPVKYDSNASGVVADRRHGAWRVVRSTGSGGWGEGRAHAVSGPRQRVLVWAPWNRPAKRWCARLRTALPGCRHPSPEARTWDKAKDRGEFFLRSKACGLPGGVHTGRQL